MAKVEGIPVYVVCNNHNDTLRSRYESLEAEEKVIRKEIREREARLAQINDEYRDLNKCEVHNVIDYIRCYSRSGNISVSDIDTYLCHCQNKLNGNINSAFLHFDNPVEEQK